MCSCLFIFFLQWLQTIFFLLHCLHLPHLFTFSITLLSFFSKKKHPTPLFFSHPLTPPFPQTPSFTHLLSSSSPMAPKAKKSSYILSSDAFHLTRWSGAMRLIGLPPLTYRSENHIPMAESISFQKIFSFSSFSMILHFNVFLAM